jgi:hypothetical protein
MEGNVNTVFGKDRQLHTNIEGSANKQTYSNLLYKQILFIIIDPNIIRTASLGTTTFL